MNIEVKNSVKLIDYNESMEFLNKRVQGVISGKENELIWVLEHKTVYTKGTNSNHKDLINRKIKVIQTNRGGKHTLHSPGQKVVYFVLDLNRRGKDIKKLLKQIETCMIDIAKELLDGGKIILPETVITSLSFEGEEVTVKNICDVSENEMILDQMLTRQMQDAINVSKTILWNGPLGVFENQLFETGTRDLSIAIASSDAFSIAGGGETISAINKFIKADDVSYCSTGGGAFLEFMEGKDLPSIQALKSKI